MGCSASRPNTLLLAKDETLAYSSSLENSAFSSSSSSSCSNPPVARAFSLQTPLVHHPPSKKGDSHHLVSLTSTTYGSLDPNSLHQNHPQSSPKRAQALAVENESLSPDSVINTWELMDGLDDDMEFHLGNSKSSFSDHSIYFSSKSSSFCHVGLDGSSKKLSDSFDSEDKTNPLSNTKPLWKLLSEESFLSKMDPNVVSSYRRALSSRQLGGNSKCNSFANQEAKSVGSTPINFKDVAFTQNTDEKIVVYFTSLRGIRKTYEDCCEVRMILQGFRVAVDERDISMDSSYRKELQSEVKGKAMSLPQVFIRGKHVGGVEEIRQLNESGELGKLLDGLPLKDPRIVCEKCGDARFLPCWNCNGSRKVFDLEEEQLRRCLNCNENGLIRCPGCC